MLRGLGRPRARGPAGAGISSSFGTAPSCASSETGACKTHVFSDSRHMVDPSRSEVPYLVFRVRTGGAVRLRRSVNLAVEGTSARDSAVLQMHAADSARPSPRVRCCLVGCRIVGAKRRSAKMQRCLVDARIFLSACNLRMAL